MSPTRSLPRLAFVVALAACTRGEAAPATTDSAAARHAAEEAANRRRVDSLAKTGATIDSILAIAEHVRRFRATLGGDRPDTLRHAAPSREAVAARWLAAATANDTTALRRLVVDRAEFLELYYPSTPLAAPPYEMPPELLWSQLLLNSEDGGTKVLRVLGGHRTRLVSLRCPDTPRREGPNVLHQDCLVTLEVDGRIGREARAFGTILERDGRFKLLGLSSKL
jgi:hypothetical protein